MKSFRKENLLGIGQLIYNMKFQKAEIQKTDVKTNKKQRERDCFTRDYNLSENIYEQMVKQK